MKFSPDGGPLVAVMHNGAIGAIKNPDGTKSLVIQDQDTLETTAVILRDDQVEAFYDVWHGRKPKKVETATPQEAEAAIAQSKLILPT